MLIRDPIGWRGDAYYGPKSKEKINLYTLPVSNKSAKTNFFQILIGALS